MDLGVLLQACMRAWRTQGLPSPRHAFPSEGLSPGHNQDNEKARPPRGCHSAADAGGARAGNDTGKFDSTAISDVLRVGEAEDDEHVKPDEILLAGWSGGGGAGYPQEVISIFRIL